MSFSELEATQYFFPALKIIILLIALAFFVRSFFVMRKVVLESEPDLTKSFVVRIGITFFHIFASFGIIMFGFIYGTSDHVMVQIEAAPRLFEHTDKITVTTNNSEEHSFRQSRINEAMIRRGEKIIIHVDLIDRHITGLNQQLEGIRNNRNDLNLAATSSSVVAATEETAASDEGGF
jgi:hypothetical protein